MQIAPLSLSLNIYIFKVKKNYFFFQSDRGTFGTGKDRLALELDMPIFNDFYGFSSKAIFTVHIGVEFLNPATAPSLLYKT